MVGSELKFTNEVVSETAAATTYNLFLLKMNKEIDAVTCM